MTEYLELERKLVPRTEGTLVDSDRIRITEGFSPVREPYHVFSNDRYFDGKGYSLARTRIGLRIRRERNLVLTLKREVIPGEIGERLEVNHDLETSPADLEMINDLAAYSGLAAVVEARRIIGGGGSFRYVLGVNSVKKVMPVMKNGVYLELSVDTSIFVLPNEEKRDGAEIEIEFNPHQSTTKDLEIVRGELDALATALCEQHELVPNPNSKYLRGLKLHGLL